MVFCSLQGVDISIKIDGAKPRKINVFQDSWFKKIQFYPLKFTKFDGSLMGKVIKREIKMIRKNSCGNITDEEFLNIVISFDKKMDKYLIKYMYEYVAHYLAIGYEMSALWECTIEQQVNSSLTRFTDPLLDGIFNYDKLDKILKDKYKLKIVDRKHHKWLNYRILKLDESKSSSSFFILLYRYRYDIF